MADSPHERRERFRIDDKVHLDVRVLTDEEYQHLLQAPFDDVAQYSLVSQLRGLTAQAGNLMVNIRKANPDVAHYLALLDRKIDMLAAQLEGSRGGGALAPDTRVNMSAGGLAFWREQPLQKGDKLDMRLVLFPSYLRIHALAEVVHAEEDTQAPAHHRFRVGVTFARLAEAEKDALVRHLIELQSAQLRRQRGR